MQGAVGYPFNCKFTRESSSENFFLKSVKTWPNYGNESVARFFGPPCVYTLRWLRSHKPISVVCCMFWHCPCSIQRVKWRHRIWCGLWSWRATFAGVSSSSRDTCPNTEMRRRDRRWNSEVRPVRWSTSLFLTRSQTQTMERTTFVATGRVYAVKQRTFLPLLLDWRRLCLASFLGCKHDTARICRWALAPVIDRYHLQQTRCTLLLLSIDGTDRRTDA